jgi:hypothetical protein
LDLEHVLVDAGELSRLYTAKFLGRSLDLVHVAGALAASCTTSYLPPSIAFFVVTTKGEHNRV